MQAHRVLIVEDDSSLRTALFRVLDRQGFQVVTANCKREAETLSQTTQNFDLALIDLHLPDGNGMDLMRTLRLSHPNLQVIVLTGHGSIELAVQATQSGAFQFFIKPFDIDQLLLQIRHSMQSLPPAIPTATKPQIRETKNQDPYESSRIVGQSDEIRRVLIMVERVADSDSTVLITGESGTGKELVARAIHQQSPRSTKSFIPINCGAIPGELLESELFGHVKGAFTGAIANRVGRFELASGGTLFLDEIAELSLSLQVKLLRVLQERKFEPVGSTRTLAAEVRVVAATNVDLAKAVQRGQFREDLFYRLNVIPINIPPLRQRRSDIPLLLHHYTKHFNATKGRHLSGFSPQSLEILFNYSWPGNIRELENLVERLAILKGSGTVDISDLPEQLHQGSAAQPPDEHASFPDNGMDFNTAVDAYENALILQALEKTGWNRNQAALLLNLNRTTLVEKIKKKGLRPPEVSS